MTTNIQQTVSTVQDFIPGLDSIIDSVSQLGPPGVTLLVCLFVGRALKTWPKFDNAKIPTVLPLIGAVVFLLMMGPAWINLFKGFIYGGFAVGVHQWWKNRSADSKSPPTP